MKTRNEKALETVTNAIADLEAGPGFMRPLIHAWRTIRPTGADSRTGIKTFAVSDIPGIDAFSFDDQIPMVRLFCAIHGALYISASDETSAERQASIDAGLRHAAARGIEIVMIDDLS